MTDHKTVTEAAQRVIKAVEPLGYEVQRDALLVFHAYCEQRKTLQAAGLIDSPVVCIDAYDELDESV